MNKKVYILTCNYYIIIISVGFQIQSVKPIKGLELDKLSFLFIKV